MNLLRIFHYSPWYTYHATTPHGHLVENLSLFTLIYLLRRRIRPQERWESFIIRLDILTWSGVSRFTPLRIFHYSPWYTYRSVSSTPACVENLSLFTLIYLDTISPNQGKSWESFIIHLDILNCLPFRIRNTLRIFHYSPWYTYGAGESADDSVENLSLFTLIYLRNPRISPPRRWESFIIHLDILTLHLRIHTIELRIFHYSPWYT